MISEEELMQRFHLIAEADIPIWLFNTYRGVPVTHTATILSIGQGYVTFGVHEHQAVCLALEGKTHLRGDLLPEAYQAQTVAVDVMSRQAVLAGFTGAGHTLGKRMAIRVQPREPADVEIYAGDRRIAGKLADISTIGLGVFTFATYIYGDLSFEKNAGVFVDVRMPVTNDILRFQGRVASVAHPKGTELRRMGIRLLPDPEAEAVLTQYVQARQDEIRRELEAIYESMLQERSRQMQSTRKNGRRLRR